MTTAGWILGVVAAWGLAVAEAQTVVGRVVDPSGAAVPGAHISVAQSDGPWRDIGASGAAGEFTASLGGPRARIRVRADGFAEALRDLAPDAGSGVPVVIELQLEDRTTTVTVTESGAYQNVATGSATRTPTALVNVPQSVSVVSRDLMRDQMMASLGDVVRYVPGVTAVQGENNRDQVVIRGNSSSADFFVNGVRDDVQYYRDLYNAESVEVLKGPNAMVFGRGGGGGVVNRVTKQPDFLPVREISLEGGAFGHKRISSDFGHGFGDRAAVRVNSVYENSGSFRRFVGLERYGVNPTLLLAPSRSMRVTLTYEYFHDGRVADRGMPSYRGRPADLTVDTYFGNPADARVRAGVNLGSALVERQFGPLNLRTRLLAADYDRFYQNYVPGAINAGLTAAALSAYNNATSRRNLFDQTDVTWTAGTGRLRHTLLWGGELGRQATGNFRQTGYFSGATATVVPLDHPETAPAAVFRQSATDADNRVDTRVAAAYLQDQVELTRFLQVVAGVRIDRFSLTYRNHRTGEQLGRTDRLLSPRAGLVLKPASGISLYGSYGVSWLPSAGDQFSSLTTVTQQVKPEKFTNLEAGAKWEVRRSLSLTAAAYRLDRTNTRATDPNDPTRIVQTGSQRTNGFEIGANGSLMRRWRVAGGIGRQDAIIRSATAAALAGARVGQTPRHTFSLWNHLQVTRRLSMGLGVLNRADMFAAVDNTVVLPGYTRADAAAFYRITEKVRLQANVENLLNRRYTLNADGNNNISPGSPRAVRIGLVAAF
jgi:catecholate siderophore receptor